jgi:hypothetical protein
MDHKTRLHVVLHVLRGSHLPRVAVEWSAIRCDALAAGSLSCCQGLGTCPSILRSVSCVARSLSDTSQSTFNRTRYAAGICPCLPMSTLARTALNLRKNESTDSLWPSPHPGLWNSIHCSRRDTRLLRLRPAIVVVPPKLRVRESSQMISLDALPRPLRVPATRPSHHHRPSITPAHVLSAASRLTASYIDALAFRVHCRPWAARDSLDYSG